MTTNKLWAFNDAHNWGVMLMRAALQRGYDARLFEDAREPDEGAVFAHMHHHPQVRNVHKRMMAVLATNPKLVLVPNYRSSVLYDDKLEQTRSFAKYMPRTQVFTTPQSASKYLNSGNISFPFVSKSSEGAGSHNVRMIKSMTMARDEVRFAFSDIGIKCKYGQEQRGYVYWQDFVPDNEGDIRIIAIGGKRMLMRRQNRPERPMASGSGLVTPITKLDDELISAMEFSNKFFTEERQTWCGIDLVKDHKEGTWRLLETTVGWTMNSYYECRVFKADGTPTKSVGQDIWNVFLDEVEAGAFA